MEHTSIVINTQHTDFLIAFVNEHGLRFIGVKASKSIIIRSFNVKIEFKCNPSLRYFSNIVKLQETSNTTDIS